MTLSTQALKDHALKQFRANLAEIWSYINDPEVQEIMINDPASIFIEKNGQFEALTVELHPDALKTAITNVANLNNKTTTQILDCRLPGLRIAATLEPISHRGPSMCIRRHSTRVFSLADYVQSGAFAPQWGAGEDVTTQARPSDACIAQGGQGLAELLRWIVHARHNIIVSGSTSAGKTTLLNAIAAEIPLWHRVGTIEDTAELRILVRNQFGFEANAAYGVDIRQLVRHALRYRPNRIIVGEVRGAEAFDMLDAYNTGHPGSMVSFHSDSAHLALARLESLVRMAPEAANWPLEDLRRQIAATFRFVIHAAVQGAQRGPQEVLEVLGVGPNGQYQTRTLFQKKP